MRWLWWNVHGRLISMYWPHRMLRMSLWDQTECEGTHIANGFASAILIIAICLQHLTLQIFCFRSILTHDCAVHSRPSNHLHTIAHHTETVCFAIESRCDHVGAVWYVFGPNVLNLLIILATILHQGSLWKNSIYSVLPDGNSNSLAQRITFLKHFQSMVWILRVCDIA